MRDSETLTLKKGWEMTANYLNIIRARKRIQVRMKELVSQDLKSRRKR